MNHPWKAERIITSSCAKSLIEKQFKTLTVSSIEPIGNGWDNTAFLVNDEFVFRFPRRQTAVPLIELESLVLNRLTKILPLDIPHPVWYGSNCSEYPWTFLGYRHLSGLIASSKSLKKKDRSQSVRAIAKFLNTLHSIPIRNFPELKNDSIGRLSLDKTKTRSEELFLQLKGHGFKRFERTANKAFDLCKDVSLKQQKQVIVHGDFYASNILVDEDNRITGVIDWGDLHIASPAVDLYIVFSFLPPSTHEEFRKHYGPITNDEWNLARMRATLCGLTIANYGLQTRNESLFCEGKKMLKFVRNSLIKES